jgi:sodium/bile acid cotransporter 7
MKPFVVRHWFLFGLLLAFVTGAIFSEQLGWFSQLTTLHKCIVASVMLLTTLPVDFQTIRNTVARPAPAFVAMAMAYVFVPLLSWPIARWLFAPDLAMGIMVAAVTPTTLATGAVWTRRAEGNDVIPIMVTLLTNLTCFVVAPFWLWLTMSRSTSFDLPVGDTMQKLFLIVVLPMVLGQLVRRQGNMAAWSTENKRHLSTISLCGILLIVLVGAVQCGHRFRVESISPWERGGEFLMMLIAVAVIHIVALVVAWQAAMVCGFARADAIGVAFAGSQKTLMVGLQLALLVGGGLAIMPLFTYHFFQLVFDTFVADYWRESAPSEEEANVD